ncbi:hypothetical protein [Acidithiobacillus sp.]|uniref:hypothetical protein n=1 Tax=Acidithiobacillus sp. TaxID=1872118 RepID=UPI003D0415B3
MPRLPLCETDIIQLSDAIKAMAHPLRYKMVCLLGNGEMRARSRMNCNTYGPKGPEVINEQALQSVECR